MKTFPRFLFILGHPRSGTTLLNKILNAHPRIYFEGSEFNDMPYFYFRQKTYEKFHERSWSYLLKDMVTVSGRDLRVPLLKAKDFRSALEEFLKVNIAVEQYDFIGQKMARRIAGNCRMIQDAFPDAVCLHMIRDPRDVHLSVSHVPHGTKSPFYNGKSWREETEEICRLGEHLKDYYEIRYEDLVREPRRVLTCLCAKIGIEFHPNMLVHYKFIDENLTGHFKKLHERIDSNNCGKWTRMLSEKDRERVEAAAGPNLYRFGYAERIHNQRVSAMDRFNELVVDHCRKLAGGYDFRLRKEWELMKISLRRRLSW